MCLLDASDCQACWAFSCPLVDHLKIYLAIYIFAVTRKIYVQIILVFITIKYWTRWDLSLPKKGIRT